MRIESANQVDSETWEQKYNLYNPKDRETIKEFEKELAGRNWDQYALDTGLMVKDGKYKTGAVVKSKNWEYFCNSKKWHALQDLRYIREKAAGKNLESLVEQMPEEDDFHSRIKELL